MKRRMVEGSDAFRAELVKVMPRYSWTVHQSFSEGRIEATGTQSSGSNRLSTLSVIRTQGSGGVVRYEARSSGYGTRAPWLHTNTDRTLARALRGLQEHYERRAATYRSHAADLQSGRNAGAGGGGPWVEPWTYEACPFCGAPIGYRLEHGCAGGRPLAADRLRRMRCARA